MRIKRGTIILITLIFAEILFSIYVFNFTTRNKNPATVWESPIEINCIDVSYTGDSLVCGMKDGHVFLMQGNSLKIKQTYQLSQPPSSIKMSKTGNYFASLDGESNLVLFSNVPITVEGLVRPLWVKRLPEARLLDVYSNEGMPPLVYILVSSNGTLNLIQKDGTTVWEYESKAESITAVISFDGSWIAAVDSEGEVYLFNKNTPSPVWNYSSGLRGASVSISLRGERVAVAGECVDNGAGKLIVLSGRTGELVLCKDWSETVRDVSISADGKRVYIHKGEEDISVLNISEEEAQEQTIRVEGGLEYSAASPFSSYIVGVSSSETVYLYYLDRPEPLWRFSPGSTPSYVSLSQDGDTIFVSVKNSIFLLQNDEFNEMVPGSRLCWSIVFFSSTVAIFLLFFAERTLNYFKGLGRLETSFAIIGTVIWVLVSVVFLEGWWKSALFGVGVFLGGLVYLKGKRLSSTLAGAYIGCFGSAAGGLLGSMITWFRGSEASVFKLVLMGVVDGLRIGALSGLVGSVSALILLALYYKVGVNRRLIGDRFNNKFY